MGSLIGRLPFGRKETATSAEMWCLKNVFERKKKDKGDKGGGGDGGGSSGGQANARRQDSGESGSSGDGGAGGAGSRVSHEAEEIEEQQRVNKLIEKQIKKDKRRFRWAQRRRGEPSSLPNKTFAVSKVLVVYNPSIGQRNPNVSLGF